MAVVMREPRKNSSMILMVLVAGAIAVLACARKESADNQRMASATSTLVKTDSGVAVNATIKAGAAEALEVKASAQSAAAGATVVFPPGTFATDETVTVEAGFSLVLAGALPAAGLGDWSVVVEGPSLSIGFANDRDAQTAFTVHLPIPSLGLQGHALALDNAQVFVVFRANIADSVENEFGHYDTADLLIDGDMASFSTLSSGVYQTLLLAPKSPQAQASSVPTSTAPSATTSKTVNQTSTVTTSANQPLPIEDIPEQEENLNGSLPGAFMVDLIDGTQGSLVEVRWDMAAFVVSYSMVVASDAACTLDAVSYSDIKTLGKDIEPVTSGDNYLCLTATNTFGSTAASNSPLKFVADIEAPATMAAPAISLSGAIELVVSWSLGTDNGGAGLNHYDLQVITAEKKAAGDDPDVYNDYIVGATEYRPIGFSGKTYYARVRAVDKAGNAGVWSPYSAAFTVP